MIHVIWTQKHFYESLTKKKSKFVLLQTFRESIFVEQTFTLLFIFKRASTQFAEWYETMAMGFWYLIEWCIQYNFVKVRELNNLWECTKYLAYSRLAERRPARLMADLIGNVQNISDVLQKGILLSNKPASS